jgi:hypothetical protein
MPAEDGDDGRVRIDHRPGCAGVIDDMDR